MILFNSFTGASKRVPNPPSTPHYESPYRIGFGATTNDFKIVRFFRVDKPYILHSYSCYVFSVRKRM